MFKCVECGAEFDKKPQYCDCGNDIFEEILPQKTPKIEDDNSNENYSQISSPDVFEKSDDPKPEFQRVEQAKNPSSFKVKQFRQQQQYYQEKPHPKKTSTVQDYMSWLIFVACLILSAIVLFSDFGFVSNNIEDNSTTETIQENKSDIPNIDSFWNNNPIVAQSPNEEINKIEEPIENEIEKVVEPIKNIIKILEPKKTENSTVKNSTNIAKTSQTTQNTKTSANSATQTKKVNNSSVNSQNTTKTSNQAVNIDLQKILNNASSSTKTTTTTNSASSLPIRTSSSTTNSTASSTSSTVQKTTTSTPTASTTNTNTKASTTTTAQTQTVNTAAQKQALANYKVGLRNTIGKKIDFTKVVGDGTCTIAFKINSSGQLVSRSFSSQSSNITLNDAVYNAVMSTPSYNQPPSGYNNETMYLKVSFTNGNYNITLN